MLPDAKNPKVNLGPEGTFTFTATGGAGDNVYELKLELFDKVDVEESKINYGVRSIFCILEKAEKKWWNKLLRGDGKPPHYVKVDWDKWADEDEDNGSGNGPADFDLGGMDFSKFGDFGGAGGGDEFEDSDDDEQEVSKPEEEDAEEKAGASISEEKQEDAAATEKTEASSA